MKYILIFVFIFSQLAWSMEDTVKPSESVEKICANKKNPEQCENDILNLLMALSILNTAVINKVCTNQKNQEQCIKIIIYTLTLQLGKSTGLKHNFSNANQSIMEYPQETKTEAAEAVAVAAKEEAEEYDPILEELIRAAGEWIGPF